MFIRFIFLISITGMTLLAPSTKDPLHSLQIYWNDLFSSSSLSVDIKLHPNWDSHSLLGAPSLQCEFLPFCESSHFIRKHGGSFRWGPGTWFISLANKFFNINLIPRRNFYSSAGRKRGDNGNDGEEHKKFIHLLCVCVAENCFTVQRVTPSSPAPCYAVVKK